MRKMSDFQEQNSPVLELLHMPQINQLTAKDKGDTQAGKPMGKVFFSSSVPSFLGGGGYWGGGIEAGPSTQTAMG